MSGIRKACAFTTECERPASFKVTRLQTSEEIECCRQHRTEIYKENAKEIGTCEVVDYGEHCNKFPYTMREVNGKLVAICRYHGAQLNDVFARLRTKPDTKAC